MEKHDLETFVPRSQAIEDLGVCSSQFLIDLKILRKLRDDGEISQDFDSYHGDRVISLSALKILRCYREFVRLGGVRHAVRQIKKEYRNNGNECK